ncbi:uncharacterized protein LOC124392358 isoform X4 [Silurus meridionalis]|uniref:uncharacterized protein LOC124392358 isoform X4 n=1 Tax=Silurus meridionalis TaxID=175797 RepID=UPI001EE9ECA5|nr:uncharacterized protein LOC124392358 isoform X4 [Silurus meridionalis]
MAPSTQLRVKVPVSDRRSSHELTAMWVVALAALLLHGSVHTAQSDFISKTVPEGNNTYLYCDNNGSVFWSKGVKEGRRTIITAKPGEGTIKHIPDPELRFSVLSDLTLIIKKVSLSDSGIYYCNAVPLYNLIITPVQNTTAKTKQDSAKKGSTAPTAPPSDDNGDQSQTTDPTPGNDADENEDSWMVPVVVSVSCLVVLLLALSVWRCFTKRKTDPQNQIHLYDSMTNLPAAPPPGFSVKQNQKLYDSIKNLADAPQSGEEQRERESVYFLPQNPTSNTTGQQSLVHLYDSITNLPPGFSGNPKLYDSIKNLADAPQCGEEQRERESVYFLAQNPTSNTTGTTPSHCDIQHHTYTSHCFCLTVISNTTRTRLTVSVSL